MAALIDPSAGSLADRLTILEIKRRKLRGMGGVTIEVLRECALCSRALTTKAYSLDESSRGNLSVLVARLAQQNVHQWEVEDAIRLAIRNLGDIDSNENIEDLRRVARIAEASARGNEKRSELIKAIDEMFGVVPEFKSYCGGAS